MPLPVLLLQLDATEEILFRRMQGLEAAEQEAFKAAAQAASQEKREWQVFWMEWSESTLYTFDGGFHSHV